MSETKAAGSTLAPPTVVADVGPSASSAALPAPLQLTFGKKRQWIGLAIPSFPLDRLKWISDRGIEPVDVPAAHITLLFGVSPDGCDAAEFFARRVTLDVGDVVFETEPRYIVPSDQKNPNDYWCLLVDLPRSPKFAALWNSLHDNIKTPGEKAEKPVLPHATVCAVKRPIVPLPLPSPSLSLAPSPSVAP